jgi:hypothetical protein
MEESAYVNFNYSLDSLEQEEPMEQQQADAFVGEESPRKKTKLISVPLDQLKTPGASSLVSPGMLRPQSTSTPGHDSNCASSQKAITAFLTIDLIGQKFAAFLTRNNTLNVLRVNVLTNPDGYLVTDKVHTVNTTGAVPILHSKFFVALDTNGQTLSLYSGTYRLGNIAMASSNLIKEKIILSNIHKLRPGGTNSFIAVTRQLVDVENEFPTKSHEKYNNTVISTEFDTATSCHKKFYDRSSNLFPTEIVYK